MRQFLLMLMMICCSINLAYAVEKSEVSERVTAVKPDGSITLSSSGNASFGNIIFPDSKFGENWLAEHLLQQMISFKTDDEDRYGNIVITTNAQEKMLRDGVAIIYARDGKIPKEWFTAEASARNAKQGVWAQKDLILTPTQAADHIGGFHVIQGRITRIYEAKAATYLNFGESWHTDFSITIPGKTRRGMKKMLQQLGAGSEIRVRGTIYQENGPMIKLTKADNLELR